MLDPYEMCTFCPRLCRHVCPVGLASGVEAATPTAMMTAVYLARRGGLDGEEAGRAAAMCVECDACTDHCKYHVPVAELLAAARAEFLPAPSVAPLGPVRGQGRWVAIECQLRSWAPELAVRLGQPVASLATSDHLGVDLIDFPGPARSRFADLERVLRGRVAVTSCGRCLRVLQAAGVPVVPLAQLLPVEIPSPRIPCRGLDEDPIERLVGRFAWGSGGMLASQRPALLRDLVADMVRQLPVDPVGCMDTHLAGMLRAAGGRVVDPLDWLMGA